MKTKEEILDNKFKERGIRKGWIDESKQAVLDAMDEYADEKLRLSNVVGQSEQLVAFGIWLDKNDKHLENGNITETVQEYLKGN